MLDNLDEEKPRRRVGEKSLAEEFHDLSLNVAKLTTWVSSIAALSVMFIAFVAWIFQNAVQDLSTSIRLQTEMQRDLFYIQRDIELLRVRVDVLEVNQLITRGE